ncbi:MAG: undecaprenyl-phosphate glucose phosphotransferase [Kiritimatiellae bacterium]|nr:undecaprenyl-phosphate glucose phosphotransferase [Kiritimatiellia bacterium]
MINCYYPLVRNKDTTDVLMSMVAAMIDSVAVFGGFIFAVWFRFDSGLIPLWREPQEMLYHTYTAGSAVATILFLFVFQYAGLYTRPQIGSFVNKIPRLIKATGMAVLLTMVLAFSFQNEADFARSVIVMAFFSICTFVLLERWILFRIEWNMARHSSKTNNVLILGTDTIAGHVKRALKKEPMLRSRVIGFLRTDLSEPDHDIPGELLKGTVDEVESFIGDNEVDQIILTNSGLGHKRILELILFCEKNLIVFNMVPDLFRIMTSAMDVQSLDDIPLLGISRWPLDLFWHRLMKRGQDILGSILGLIISAPVILIAAIKIKRESPGPVFYGQERCGEKGEPFFLYKLRTMRHDAESATGPVFTEKNDPRTTRTGTFLRAHNLDELPQFWNVLKGDMSLVGPRPERPHFVEQFKEDIGRYMWRHVSKPGMTGWAQVNGLRGNTSIEDRIKYDLYYLENWSLTFDFKILVRTLFANKNAY